MYTYAMNKMFDPKVAQKVIRFFSTGSNGMENNYRWIGIPRKIGMDKTTLFSNLGVDKNRKIVEEKTTIEMPFVNVRIAVCGLVFDENVNKWYIGWIYLRRD